MINFISTFPPIMCGIGDYTKYLVSHMPLDSWRVTSFRLDDFFHLPNFSNFDKRVSYKFSLTDSTLPSPLEGEIIWFEHAFGIWGDAPSHFLRFIKDAKRKGKKVVASFHTIHFQSFETDSGMKEKEANLLREVLPLLDALTVFTRGAYRAVVKAFPEYRDKVAIIRHGTHLYPIVSREKARKNIIDYLINQADIPSRKKQELKKNYSHFFSPKTIILGNLGFIAGNKDFSNLYRLSQLVQEELSQYTVITFVTGKIQLRKGRKVEKSLPILRELKSIHNGENNLFFEDYIPEELLPLVFRALDFVVFWPYNATQSGRVAHAQGASACIVGRKIEGIEETLKLSGLPAAETLEELAKMIERFTLHPELKEKTERASRSYAQKYFYGVQAKKHLLLAESLIANKKLPVLDGAS